MLDFEKKKKEEEEKHFTMNVTIKLASRLSGVQILICPLSLNQNSNLRIISWNCENIHQIPFLNKLNYLTDVKQLQLGRISMIVSFQFFRFASFLLQRILDNYYDKKWRKWRKLAQHTEIYKISKGYLIAETNFCKISFWEFFFFNNFLVKI